MKKVLPVWVVLSMQSSYAATEISGNINVDTILGPNGNPADTKYLVTDDLTVSGTDGDDFITTLSIEPGVVISFVPTRHPSLDIGLSSASPGKIIAKGTATKPIIFKSASSNPQPGDWEGIKLTYAATGSFLENIKIMHAGYNGYDSDFSLFIDCAASLSNITISHSKAHGIFIDNPAADIEMANLVVENNAKSGIYINQNQAQTVTITNSLIRNNGEYGIFTEWNKTNIILQNNSYSNNGAGPIVLFPEQVKGILGDNTFDANSKIEIKGGSINTDAYWFDFFTNFSTRYVVHNDITIWGSDGDDGVTTLEIQSGARIEFDPSRHPNLTVGISGGSPGKLVASDIIFTSTSPNPQPGDWSGLYFYSKDYQSELINCEISFGGYGRSPSNSNVRISSASPKIWQSNIEYSANSGIYIYGKSDPDIRANYITNNSKDGIYSDCSTDTVFVNKNNIFDNQEFGVRNVRTTQYVDARNCYWGSNDGPSGVGPGNGDEVSEMVLYNPWSPGTVAVKNRTIDISNIPERFQLMQNYPNPFNPSTNISYELPEWSYVKLEIFNSLGQKILELVNSEKNAGFHNTTWISDVGSGVYIYRISAQSIENPENRFIQTRKMLLMK